MSPKNHIVENTNKQIFPEQINDSIKLKKLSSKKIKIINDEKVEHSSRADNSKHILATKNGKIDKAKKKIKSTVNV